MILGDIFEEAYGDGVGCYFHYGEFRCVGLDGELNGIRSDGNRRDLLQVGVFGFLDLVDVGDGLGAGVEDVVFFEDGGQVVVVFTEGEDAGWEGGAGDYDVVDVLFGRVWLDAFEEGICLLVELDEFGGI